MPRKKESVIEPVTIRCQHCNEVVDIEEGVVSCVCPVEGTIPIYFEDGEVCLDWSSIDLIDITFEYYCPSCGELVSDWSEELTKLVKKHKRAEARKKRKEKNESNCT